MRWKKGGKEEIFTVLGGKNMIFENREGGQNINYFDNIHPCPKSRNIKQINISEKYHKLFPDIDIDITVHNLNLLDRYCLQLFRDVFIFSIDQL